jgi:hypothetical protein
LLPGNPGCDLGVCDDIIRSGGRPPNPTLFPGLDYAGFIIRVPVLQKLPEEGKALRNEFSTRGCASVFLDAAAADLTGFPGPVGPQPEDIGKTGVTGLSIYVLSKGARAFSNILSKFGEATEYAPVLAAVKAGYEGASAAYEAHHAGTCR